MKTSPVDSYIKRFPEGTIEKLKTIRSIAQDIVPGAEEVISYGVPTVKLKGKYVVYYAGYKTHIGLYPAPVDHPDFKEDLKPFKSGRATLKFPLDKKLPLQLIKRVIKHLLKENQKRSLKKA